MLERSATGTVGRRRLAPLAGPRILLGAALLAFGGLLVGAVSSSARVPAASQAATESEGRVTGDRSTVTSPEPSASEAPTVGHEESLPTEELFFSANAAYEEGEYELAAELYEQVVRNGGTGGAALYNLGNAYLRSGQLGQAIASYLRARAALPREQDVIANLAYARTLAKDDIEAPAPSEALRSLFFWHYSFSAGELWVGALLLNVVFWGCLAIRLFRRSPGWKWLAVVSGGVLVCVTASAVVHSSGLSEVAVVIPQEVNVTYGTDEDSVVRFKLHAGTEVRVIERSPGWIKIRLPDDLEGWIPEDQVDVVRL